LSLKKKVAIDHLIRKGKRISGKSIKLIWEESDEFQWAVFIPKKYGVAVKRNRLKRLIREAVRTNRRLLTRPVKIALFPQPQLVKPDFENLHAEIGHIFEIINTST